MDSLQSEIEQLRDFLGNDLLLFVSDEHTPTNTFVSSNTEHLTEKELDEILTVLLRNLIRKVNELKSTTMAQVTT